MLTQKNEKLYVVISWLYPPSPPAEKLFLPLCDQIANYNFHYLV